MLKFSSGMRKFASKMLKFASLMLKLTSLMLKFASKKKYNEKYECIQIKIHKNNFPTQYFSVNLLNPNKIQTKGNNLRDILIKKIKKIKSLFIILFNWPDPLYKYFSYCYKTYTLCVCIAIIFGIYMWMIGNPSSKTFLLLLFYFYRQWLLNEVIKEITKKEGTWFLFWNL